MSRVTISYCIRAAALIIAAVSGAANAQQVPAAASAKFVVFVRTAPVGSDEVAVTRGPGGWTLASTGSLGAPLDLVTRNLQIRYDPDWKPLEVTIDGTLRGQVFGLRITVNDGTATAHVNNAGQAIDSAGPIPPAAVFLPNPFLAAFEAVTPRLIAAPAGSVIAE